MLQNAGCWIVLECVSPPGGGYGHAMLQNAGCRIVLVWVSPPGGGYGHAKLQLQDVGFYLSGCHPLEERTIMRCCRLSDCTSVGVTPWRRGQSCNVAGCRIVLVWVSPP